MMLIGLGDTIMSYTTPVFMADQLNSTWLMGIIFSISSAIGLGCDLIFSALFNHKPYAFFIKAVLFTSIFFPLSFILFPSNPWAMIFAMAVWGVYFELLRFGQFGFVKTHFSQADHAQSWGYIEMSWAWTLILGPILAGVLIDRGAHIPFWWALTFFILAGIGYGALRLMTTKPHLSSVDNLHHPSPVITHHRPLQELKIWLVLLKRIWPLYLFFFSLVALDTAMWTIGTLLSEELRQVGWLGGLLLTAYGLPSIFVTLLTKRAALFLGKKRAAFLAGIVGSALLSIGFWFVSGIYLVAIVFAAALFIGLAYPEIYATFEDYIARLDNFHADMVGLEGSAANLAYVLGPIMAGFLGSLLGPKFTIGVFALLVLATSVLALAVTPRKLRMPQAELNKLDS